MASRRRTAAGILDRRAGRGVTALAAALLLVAAPAALAAALLLVAAPAAAAAEPPAKARSALPAFASCSALLSYARHHARRTGGSTGVRTRAGALRPQPLGRPVPATTAGAPPGAPAAESDRAAPPEFSQTNVQEAGIDEPDIVKTDGRTIFAVAGDRLLAIDITGQRPTVVGTLALGGGAGHQLLVHGDRVLVLSNAFGGQAFAADVILPASRAQLTEVDVSDPANLRVRRTLTMNGSVVDARLTGATARVVVAASPDPIRPAAIARASLGRFVPRTVLRSHDHGADVSPLGGGLQTACATRAASPALT